MWSHIQDFHLRQIPVLGFDMVVAEITYTEKITQGCSKKPMAEKECILDLTVTRLRLKLLWFWAWALRLKALNPFNPPQTCMDARKPCKECCPSQSHPRKFCRLGFAKSRTIQNGARSNMRLLLNSCAAVGFNSSGFRLEA